MTDSSGEARQRQNLGSTSEPEAPTSLSRAWTDPAPETRLMRSGKGGGTIHRRGCKRVGAKAVGWSWAEDKPDSVWQVIPWLKGCSYCFSPDGGYGVEYRAEGAPRLERTQ